MDIKVKSYFDEKIYEYPEKTINLIVLKCKMINDSYEIIEHEKVEWILKDDFYKYQFAPADKYFVNKIINNKK